MITASGKVLAVNAVESHIGGSRDQVLADIDTALEPFREESVAGLGIGFPSFGDYDRGVLDTELSGYPSMHGFPLRQHLENAFGLPTKMVPDANLFAHGILRFGEGRRFGSFMAIALGTGTAIGLVRDGEVLTGPRGFPEPTMRSTQSGAGRRRGATQVTISPPTMVPTLRPHTNGPWQARGKPVAPLNRSARH